MTTKKTEVIEPIDYEQVAEQLAKKYNVSKVHVYVGKTDEGEDVVGFIKEPTYAQKLFAMDKIATNQVFSAGDAMRESLLIREESDPRTYEEEKYMLGIAGECVKIIDAAQNTFKKK